MKTNLLFFRLLAVALFGFTILPCVTSCDDFVKIDPPQTALVKSTVFTSDATATAAILDIYYNMSHSGFASGDINSITFVASLSGDEMIDFNSAGDPALPFYQNSLNSVNTLLASIWASSYTTIYKANAIVEGLESSSGVSAAVHDQLEGEAKFIRAFCHFYLTNLFGDVPLVLSTNYIANANIARTAQALVYTQIIQDLTDAQSLMAADYSFGNNARTRANKWAATALLARAYLYTGDWANAETQATNVLANTGTYNLVPQLVNVFHVNSLEAIWQLETLSYPPDLFTFYVFYTPAANAFRNGFVDVFEPGDQRRSVWVGNILSGTDTLYFPTKYQSFTPQTEYSTALRLAEQYLIRAEARAQLSKVAGAQDDLNAVRTRAGLPNTTAGDRTSLLAAVEHERQVELFTEWGHRWLDLKRTGRVDAVLGPVKTGWVSDAALYPIPQQQLLTDPAMKNAQNPGY